MKKVLVLLADGFEEIETVTPIDLLRRAGANVTIAGVTGKIVTGANGLKIESEISIDECDDKYDCVIVPGGTNGAKNISASKICENILINHYKNKSIIGAICAGPALVLYPLGFLKGRTATAYPGLEKGWDNVKFSQDSVVVDENIVTSRGVGTSAYFGLKLIELLFDKNLAEDIKLKTVIS